MKKAITTVALLCAVLAYGQEDGHGSVEYDPAKTTPEMKAQTETIAKALEGLTPEGWKQVSLIERYTPINLYDKINGRSELYNQYDVRGMTFVSYVRPEDPAQYIDLFLYDMQKSLGAFGVYSVERWGDDPTLDVGRGAYRTDNDFFFWKGGYYVTVLGGTDDEVVQKGIDYIVEKLEARLEDDKGKIWGESVMPSKGRKENSLKYFSADALSLEFLSNTFTAVYAQDGEEYTAYISGLESGAEASEVMTKFKAYTEKYGKDTATDKMGDLTIHSANMGGGYYDCMFRIGTHVGGVTGGTGKDFTLEAAKRLALEWKNDSL